MAPLLSLLLGTALLWQAPEPPWPPSQPVAAFLALPVSPTAPDGQVVHVLDDSGQPVPMASVFVADWTTVTDGEREAARHFFGADAPIWLAARSGKRFRTAEDGSVRVPRQPRATVGAIHPTTGAVALCLVGQRIRLRGRRVPIPVEVLDAEGRPAADVPVAVGRGDGDLFGTQAGAFTDARGRVTLLCQEPAASEDSLRVRVTCVDGPAAAAPVHVPAAGTPVSLRQLRLPPVVGVRLQLRDAGGQLVRSSRLVAIGQRFGGATQPLRIDGDGYFVWPIAPGGEVRVELRHDGAVGAPQQHVLRAPTTAGAVATESLTVQVLPPAVPDPRVAAALRQRQGNAPPGVLPEGGMGHVVHRVGGRPPEPSTVGSLRLLLDPVLASVDGLRCELSRLTSAGEIVGTSHHVLVRNAMARGSMPRDPALLSRLGVANGAASHELRTIDPGSYRVRVLIGASEVAQWSNVDVRAGEAAWPVPVAAAPLPTGTFRLLGPDGAPTFGEILVQGHAEQRLAANADGTVAVPLVAGVAWIATAPRGRSRLLPAAGAERVDVPVEPRCRVRVFAAQDVVVPDGVLLRFGNQLEAELDTWHPFRTGSDNVVRPDATGMTTVSLWVQRPDLTREPLRVEWRLGLPAGDREVAFELALDAEQLEAIARLQSRR
jgi:hypothetical protein